MNTNNKDWLDPNNEIGPVILDEVESLVNELFVTNVGNTNRLKDDILAVVYELMIENTWYLGELVDLGEYYLTDDNEVKKSILSNKDLNSQQEYRVDCPVCNSKLTIKF